MHWELFFYSLVVLGIANLINTIPIRKKVYDHLFGKDTLKDEYSNGNMKISKNYFNGNSFFSIRGR